jgi:hypothetical protein
LGNNACDEQIQASFPGRVLNVRLSVHGPKKTGVAPQALICLGCFSLQPPRKRHPERSALQIYRVTLRLGAESKDPEGAYLTHAARTFSTTEAREQDLAAVPT